MGREATITPDQVHAIAEAIKGEGGKPTLRAVRERLGTGSMGTINKYLQAWKAGQDRPAVPELAIPPALQRAILDFMSAELAGARAPLETDLADALQTAADLASENERQVRTIEDQVAQLEALAAEKAAAEGKAEQLTMDLAEAREGAAEARQAAEAARNELTRANLRLEALPRLEADLAAVRVELARERQARIEAEQNAAVLGAQKNDLEGRLVEVRKDAERNAEQLQRAQDRAEQLGDSLADARVTVQSQQTRIQDLAAQLDQARSEARDAGERAAVLTSQKTALEGRLQQLEPAAPASGAEAGTRPRKAKAEKGGASS